MKKLVAWIVVSLLFVALIGCKQGRTLDDIVAKEPSIQGVVKDIYDDMIMVESRSEDGRTLSRYDVSLKVECKDSVTDFTLGDEVIIYYNGEILETYPVMINTVYAIVLVNSAE